MGYNYSKLNGCIIERYGTQAKFAEALGISPRALSKKLNNYNRFTQTEIDKACDLLGIPLKKVELYFFAK